MNIFEVYENNMVDEAKKFPLSDTASITLIPTGGDKARIAFERMMEPYSVRLNAGGKLSDEENRTLNVKFFAEHVIKGWEGILDRDNKPIKFTPENAKNLLSDKKLEGFFSLIVKMASNDAAFEAAREEDDAGN